MLKKSKGFTLIELIVVVAILGIIIGIATPRLAGYRNLARERVCDANRNTVERLYDASLLENDHDDSTFNAFLIRNFDEVCPQGGTITYAKDKVKCSLHRGIRDKKEEELPEDEVPWL